MSLRDPLRSGVDDTGLKEIIGAAVCSLPFYLFSLFCFCAYKVDLAVSVVVLNY